MLALRFPASFRYCIPVAGLSCLAAGSAAMGGELPVPCVAGTCGANGPTAWVTSGSAQATLVGNALNVQQNSASAVLNWQSFNISQDASVAFSQPDSSSVAVNRIFQADPSRIFGALRSNGTVYLINQNGILFGPNSRVDVGGLLASTLDIAPQAISNGILAPAATGAPAFAVFRDANGAALPSAPIEVEAGAKITASEGGQVLMFAPGVTNRGTISTPGGQTLLAAGDSVYLAASGDPNLRGLLVEVGVGGTVTNGDATALTAAVGQIVAERGNVTLAGLAVNQLGRVTATTSVRQNGSVRLQARDGGSAQVAGGAAVLNWQNGGTLQLAGGSVTEAVLSDDTSKTVDVNEQPRSQIQLSGAEVDILGSRVSAPAGEIDALASRHPIGSAPTSPGVDDSRIYVAPSAVVDVAGSSVDLPMSSNLVRVELRGTQLADSPLQRDGPLRGKAVYVDARRTGTNADGTTWQGTPLANVSGDIAAMQRGLAERNLKGGSINLTSQGSVLVAPTATLDVSGGEINYQAGYLSTSQLLGVDGKIYDIGDADPNRQYVGVLGNVTVDHHRWGVSETFTGFPGIGGSQGVYQQGYVEGKDAGNVTVSAPTVVLDGDILGHTVAGTYQRKPTADAGTGLYRSFDQIPAGARLVVGEAGAQGVPDFLLTDVTFHDGLVLPRLRNADGTPFDPLSDPLQLVEANLRPSLFGTDRVAQLVAVANRNVHLDAGEALALPSGGSVQVVAGGVEIGGDIDAPSGSISLTAKNTFSTAIADSHLDVAASASLLARGQWVNDQPDSFATPGNAPLWINGGSISLSSQRELDLASGALLDVSAGAWVRKGGVVTAGVGGNVAAAVKPVAFGDPVDVSLGAAFRGYSIAQSGSLKLELGAVCIAATDCSGGTDAATWLPPSLFGSGGFASYSVTANSGGVTMAPDTIISLRHQNLQLTSGAQTQATGTPVDTLTSLVELPDYLRSATNLSLSVALAPMTLPVTNAVFAELPSLRLGNGSWIQADPLARIALTSNTSLVVDGRVTAPGGTIALQLTNKMDTAEFLATQGLWLDRDSVLDTSGVARLVPNTLNLLKGDVLPGGEVDVQADRGFVVINPGARVAANGAAALLDVGAATIVDATRTEVTSAGGRIAIGAAEGVQLNGSLSAASGGGRSVGGTLALTVDSNTRGSDPGIGDSVLPLQQRTIELTTTKGPIAIAPNSALPMSLLGFASLSVDEVKNGGYAALDLTANTLQGARAGNLVTSPGLVRIDDGVSLSMPQRLTLDAATIAGSGTAQISAPYVAIGHTDRLRQDTLEPPASVGGNLRVQGSLIDLIGNSAIGGFDSVMLASDGDIRVRGLQPQNGNQLIGSLWTTADLTLQAAQVYGTTLSDFTVSLRDPKGTLTVLGNGHASGAVLSAGSTLTLLAPTLVSSGVLRAPIGQIRLEATDLTLQPGSIVSTSANGLTIPFGATQGGLDWTYQLFDQRTLVFGGASGSDLPPQQRIALSATNLSINPGAVLDASGGGDLLAYEFIPGPGGTRDVLSAQVQPNLFAVVPGLNIQFAPYDQNEYTGSPLHVGDDVYLSGYAGLAAGNYVLMPARYSLLPGAFLVRAVSGYTDLAPGQAYPQLDGSTIVSGYRTIHGTDFADARTSGFALEPASVARAQATYTTTTANVFFAQEGADGSPSPFRTPNDAGSVILQASKNLNLGGSLLARSENGRGAALDVSSDQLVVGAPGATVDPGQVLIDAAALNALGAESVFIGGARTSSSAGTTLDLVAKSVTIDSGASLTAPELIVGAEESLNVQSGATLTGATSPGRSAPPPAPGYLVAGDGALLRVAAGADVPLNRSGTSGATGQLALEPGAALVAPGGAIALDASAATRSDARLDATNGTLRLGADHIVIADGDVTTSGLVLTPTALAGLGLKQLVLSSRSTLDVGSNLSLAVDALSIEAGGIRAIAPDVTATVSVAGDLRLGNPLAIALPADVGTGHLELRADRIDVHDGTLGIAGFATSVLSANQEISGTGTAGVISTGALDLVTPRLTGDAGANLTFSAAGLLRALPTASAAAAGESGIGARLVLSGARVEAGTLLQANGGTVSIQSQGLGALGGIAIGSAGVIDVTGLTRDFDGELKAIPAGTIELAATSGDIAVASGSRLDVSGAATGDAGHISLLAPQGSVLGDGALVGHAGSASVGGTLRLDVNRVDGVASLAQRLTDGGFSDSVYIRQRGPGDLPFAGQTLTSHDVTLVADAGAISVGNVDARGEQGGSVRLMARNAVAVGGRIDASATSDEGRGGSVELSATSGSVSVGPGAVIDVSAGAGTTAITPSPGTVHVRVPQQPLLDALAHNSVQSVVDLSGTITGASSTVLEAYRTYQSAGQIADTDVLAGASNPLYNDATTFMLNAPAIVAALGRTSDTSFHVIPGVEIRATGDLHLAADWNLYPWRFNGEPGALTLRAGGDLLIDQSISDGFAGLSGTTGFQLPATPDASWSYRLVAGADGSSADPRAVVDLAALGAAGGSVKIAPGRTGLGTGVSTFKMVRTGTGTIEIDAARDFSLGNRASVVYTAGIASQGVRFSLPGQLGGRQYPTDGGDIVIDVGGNVTGAVTNQFVTNWLWRVGRPSSDQSAGVARAWTVAFDRFEQNVGALAGGNVTVRAGGDVIDLSVAIPTIGRQTGGTTSAADKLDVLGGGTLNVAAAGSIRGGTFYVGRGQGTITAGDEVTTSAPDGEAVYPVLGLGDTQFTVTARQSLGIDGVIDPFLLPQGRAQNASGDSIYSQYTDNSAVALLSTAGDLTVRANPAIATRWQPTFNQLAGTRAVGLQIYAPTLTATSFSGDARTATNMSLFPSPFGNVALLANDDVKIGTGSTLLLSDADPALLPTLASPQTVFDSLNAAFGSITAPSPLSHATVPVHDPSRRNDVADEPAHIVALTGDISSPLTAVQDQTLMGFAKPVRMFAGRDIVDVAFIAQNIDPSDITSVVAGRDIRYSVSRNEFGNVLGSNREIAIDGPGAFQLTAGRNLDLQTSAGISTRGNIVDPYLSPVGAGVSVQVGVGGGEPDYAAFTARYIKAGTAYGDQMIEYVEQLTGRTGLTFDAALEDFSALDVAHQRTLIEQLFFDELRAGGRSAAVSPNADFTQAFAALTTLFPKIDLTNAVKNPYVGDIRLFFSRIYTLNGGDISLFSPGGEINVGLAAPPASFGISKSPSQLGLVVRSTGSIDALAYNDFEVNESRVFAADGGNILVWSTEGDIDAGRGAKTAISAPPPTITIDSNGHINVNYPAALTGSGIQTLATTAGTKPGDVDLFAPRGVVNAGDAGIVAGNLTIAATAVLGADNISVSGVAVGVPVDTGGLSAALTGVSAVAASAANTAEQNAAPSRQQTQTETPLAAQALGFLDVFVTGFGEGCDSKDPSCKDKAQ